jgi:hypothetical protein
MSPSALLVHLYQSSLRHLQQHSMDARKNAPFPDSYSHSWSTAAPGKEAQAHLSEKEKAQLRRAQVRKAQIQHRERKANYVKTLEHDLARYRNLVAQAERETLALKKQNDGLRARIPGGAPAGGSDGGGDEMRKLNVAKTEEDLDADVPMLSDADLEELVQQDMTLTFEFDENMQAPCFQITSSPKPSIDSGLSADMSIATADSEGMTPEQTQEAINFVLAYVCCCCFSGHAGS